MTTATKKRQTIRTDLAKAIRARLETAIPEGGVVLTKRKATRLRGERFSDELVNLVLEEIRKGVRDQGRVYLAGVGTFDAKMRPARQHNDPNKPGGKVDVPDRYTVAFTSHSDLNEAAKRNLS